MVTCNDDLVLVSEAFEPGDLCLQLFEGAAVSEVTGVKEEVAIGHGGLGVVRVWYADY